MTHGQGTALLLVGTLTVAGGVLEPWHGWALIGYGVGFATGATLHLYIAWLIWAVPLGLGRCARVRCPGC